MERRTRSIVVGIADIQEEDPELRSAIELAEALGAMLHVVHAFRLPDPVLYPSADASVFSPDVLVQIGEVARARLEAQVRTISTSARISCRAEAGPADVAILDAAEEVGADLIAVGATRRGALARAILGTTAQRVVRAARVPVLVHRRPGLYPLERVLLTTDLSEASAPVYERALELLAALGAPEKGELRVLVAVGYDFVPSPLPPGALESAAAAELDRFMQRLGPGSPGPRGKVRMGDPAKEIVAEAEDWGADLLVLGTQGRSGASRFLIGSVAEAVLRSAPCNALVIPNAVFTAE